MINSPSKGNEGLMDNFGKLARRLSVILVLTGAMAPISGANAASPETQGSSSETPNQEITCYATGGKTPEDAATEAFAKRAGSAVEKVRADYSVVVVSGPEGAFRKVVAKMVKKAAPKAVEVPVAVPAKPSAEEFKCFASGGKTPEQAAREQYAKDKGLPIEKVESDYSVEIVSQPKGAFRETVARMVKKEIVKPIVLAEIPTPEAISIAEKLAHDSRGLRYPISESDYKAGKEIEIAVNMFANETRISKKWILENYDFRVEGVRQTNGLLQFMVTNKKEEAARIAAEAAKKAAEKAIEKPVAPIVDSRTPAQRKVLVALLSGRPMITNAPAKTKEKAREIAIDHFIKTTGISRSEVETVGSPKYILEIVYHPNKKLLASYTVKENGLGDRGTSAALPKVDNSVTPQLVKSKLDEGVLKNMLRRTETARSKCYSDQLNGNPNLKGKIVVKIEVGIHGQVTQVEFTEDTMKNEAVKSCLERLFKGYKFPVEIDEPQEVAFPLVFAPSSL